MYSMHLSGSTLGESILNGKCNPARFSMNENCGSKNGNQIVQNNWVYEEEQQQPPNIDKRNTFANPDPEEEEVVMLSPNSLTNKYPIICQICKKGFQRDQNLELHKRSHKLTFNLKRKSQPQIDKKKRAYLCPITTCLRHRRSNALGDISGIKKHFFRKHCPKTFKCPKCSKAYALRSDMRAHINNCGTADYKCDCGSLFQRTDSFYRHNKSCEVALAAKTARASTSHPQPENNSTRSETMNHNYLGNKSSPPGSHPIWMHPHQLNPPPQVFPSINNYYSQVTSPGSAQEHTYAETKTVPFLAFSSGDISTNYAFSGEPNQNLTINNPTFNGHSLLPSNELLPPQFTGERNVNYAMTQENLQNYNMLGMGSVDTPEMALLQMINMMDGSSTVGDMVMSTMSTFPVAKGEVGDGLTLNVDHYYEPPTRDIVGFGGGGGGGSGDGISSSEGEYGGGMNGYAGEGGEWANWMTILGNDHQQQHYV